VRDGPVLGDRISDVGTFEVIETYDDAEEGGQVVVLLPVGIGRPQPSFLY
jgi:hypothetical protein